MQSRGLGSRASAEMDLVPRARGPNSLRPSNHAIAMRSTSAFLRLSLSFRKFTTSAPTCNSHARDRMKMLDRDSNAFNLLTGILTPFLLRRAIAVAQRRTGVAGHG